MKNLIPAKDNGDYTLAINLIEKVQVTVQFFTQRKGGDMKRGAVYSSFFNFVT